jgi:hypothetical protein
MTRKRLGSPGLPSRDPASAVRRRSHRERIAEFVDELPVRPSIGGADTNVHAALWSFAVQIVWAVWTGIDLHGQHLRTAPGQDLDLGHQSRSDQVAARVGQSLLQVERIANATDPPALVLNAHEHRSTRGVGEGDYGSECSLRSGEIALELERLALL